jgi:hypothetical protein
VDVEKRLLKDAASFAKEVTSLDKEGFISRTLAVLGISAKDSDAISDQEQETSTPKARPHSAAGPARGHRF